MNRDADFASWLDACATGLCLTPGKPEAAFRRDGAGPERPADRPLHRGRR
ncbi:hypothetical protein KCH_07820 [Kitasatospora cheerisanensis KCTC 2395]|uniref:Uncharacterized protein n=1 Tax=Kitasatospora cheerisanensis KCTC 2395 TaxID=1348663 RepID=A0A066ZB83_9ACTN|nr:hypothetical protein KCH_07820 [Kitasatospora cheerisanensis KCTC 2395]